MNVLALHSLANYVFCGPYVRICLQPPFIQTLTIKIDPFIIYTAMIHLLVLSNSTSTFS